MTDRYLDPFKDWETTLMQKSFDALGHLLYGLEDSLDTDSPEDYDGPMTDTTYDDWDWDDEVPWPEWLEENLYGDSEDLRDRYEEAYNEMLMDGGDL